MKNFMAKDPDSESDSKAVQVGGVGNTKTCSVHEQGFAVQRHG